MQTRPTERVCPVVVALASQTASQTPRLSQPIRALSICKILRAHQHRQISAADSDNDGLKSGASGFLISFPAWQINIADRLIIRTTLVSPAPVDYQDFAYTLACLLTIVVGIGMIRAASRLLLSTQIEQLVRVARSEVKLNLHWAAQISH
jgi:hypothetical protein